MRFSIHIILALLLTVVSHSLPTGSHSVTTTVPFAAPASPLPLELRFHGCAPPYRVYSDDSPEITTRVLSTLRTFRQEFLAAFSIPLPSPPTIPTVRVYWFAHQHNFQSYAAAVAPHLTGSAGFFWHDHNLLVLLNQRGTDRYRHLLLSPLSPLPPGLNRLPAPDLRASWQQAVTRAADEANEQLIRHEAAHQLLHELGWLSSQHPTWLDEGLAQYCESTPIGTLHPRLVDRVRHFRDTGQLLPLPELLAHQAPTGFLAHDSAQTEIAYAQSWALVWWLMQPPRRDAFLALLRRESCRGNSSAGNLTPPNLATALEITESQLMADWDAWLQRL